MSKLRFVRVTDQMDFLQMARVIGGLLSTGKRVVSLNGCSDDQCKAR